MKKTLKTDTSVKKASKMTSTLKKLYCENKDLNNQLKENLKSIDEATDSLKEIIANDLKKSAPKKSWEIERFLNNDYFESPMATVIAGSSVYFLKNGKRPESHTAYALEFRSVDEARKMITGEVENFFSDFFKKYGLEMKFHMSTNGEKCFLYRPYYKKISKKRSS